MARFGVTVMYKASHSYVIEAEDDKQAEEIAQEISQDEPAHDHYLYDIEVRRMRDDEGPVDNDE